MKIWTLITIGILLGIAFMLSSCVSRKTYRASVGLAAIAGYTAGIADCGDGAPATAENVKKRIDQILNSKKGDRP